MLIKDTKLGKWLKSNAPKVLEVVGDALPSSGVLGIIKNLLKDNIPPEQRLEFEKMEYEFSLEFTKIELNDRQDARSREIEYITATGHSDWMQIIVGSLIMASFVACLITITYKPIPEGNEHVIVNAIGILEGLVLSVAGYYYGSSLGSRIKDLKR